MPLEGITRSSTALSQISAVSRHFPNLKIHKPLISLSILIMSMAIRLPCNNARPNTH
jgi:hypothetical protein